MSVPRPYVAVSRIAVPPEGVAALETAFAERLGEVEDDAFRADMRSEAHRRSHTRMPGGPARPRPAGLSTFEVVAR